MRWATALGRLFALSWLVLLWPLLAAVFHSHLAGAHLVALCVAFAAYIGVYVSFSLWGYRRRDPPFVVAEVVALSLLGLAVNELSSLKTANPFLLPLIVAGFGFRPRLGFLVILALSGLALADTLTGPGVPPGETAFEIAVLGPQLLLAGAAAMGLRYLLDVQGELRAARTQLARLAVDEERARISRDLHDLLGHSLAVITMKGELASRLIPPDDAGGAEVREMVRLSREALREVREAVSGYRQPTLATELSAARTALEAAGIGLDVEQRIGAVPRETESVLGWAIREGVTNVIRHSRASHCSIVLSREDGLVRADITDDGPARGVPAARVPRADGLEGGPPPQTRGVPAARFPRADGLQGGLPPQSRDGATPGVGLRGLGERVDAIGGQLEAGRLPARGYRLRVVAPAGPPP